ncbi:MAG: hypothetical protein FJ286_10080 [Planctomycetes bacterium]|nr:hypothetical protein [Planctomycetota bacterium]
MLISLVESELENVVFSPRKPPARAGTGPPLAKAAGRSVGDGLAFADHVILASEVFKILVRRVYGVRHDRDQVVVAEASMPAAAGRALPQKQTLGHKAVLHPPFHGAARKREGPPSSERNANQTARTFNKTNHLRFLS